MPKVTLDLEATVPPERIRAALLDFSPDRPALWPGIEPALYEVYSVGETSALVKEGSKMPGTAVWAVEEYDWADPTTVTWTVRESNFCTPGSSVSAAIEPRGSGSRVRIVWNRTPTSFMSRLVMAVIVATRGKPVAASFEKGMRILERAPAA
jgi:Polyketide cyclase / dehydrase and lipid transport